MTIILLFLFNCEVRGKDKAVKSEKKKKTEKNFQIRMSTDQLACYWVILVFLISFHASILTFPAPRQFLLSLINQLIKC